MSNKEAGGQGQLRQIEYRPVRRIVTGTNAEGRSVIASDGTAPNVFWDPGRLPCHVLWATGEARAPGDEPAPPGHKFPFHSHGGSLLRVADFPPDSFHDQAEVKKFLDESGVIDGAKPRHFMFHKTESLDYAIVLEGEIWAMMDEGEALMKAGDILIQRATNHSWSNRSDKVCRVAFVLLDLLPNEPV
jgi:hypothetical protein